MEQLAVLLGVAYTPWKLAGLATTPLELLSFLLSVATVWFNIRQSHWGWLFAIISSATYGLVFFGSRLYGDMGLQLVFISVSILAGINGCMVTIAMNACP
jgi:nicotinamide mononucleotide transporter